MLFTVGKKPDPSRREKPKIPRKIELYDASELSPGVCRLAWICDMAAKNDTGRIIYGKSASAISGDPDILCFLLLDDPTNELFLSAGLGADRILTN